MKLFGRRDADDGVEDSLEDDDRLELAPEPQRTPRLLLLSAGLLVVLCMLASPVFDMLDEQPDALGPEPAEASRMRAPSPATPSVADPGRPRTSAGDMESSPASADEPPPRDLPRVPLRSAGDVGDGATARAGDRTGSRSALLVARAQTRDPGDLVSRYGSYDGQGRVRHVFAPPPGQAATVEASGDGVLPQTEGGSEESFPDDAGTQEPSARDLDPDPIPHHRVTLVMVSRHGSRAVVDSTIVRAGDRIEAGVIVGIGSGGILVDGRFGMLEYDLGVAGARRKELDAPEPPVATSLAGIASPGSDALDAPQVQTLDATDDPTAAPATAADGAPVDVPDAASAECAGDADPALDDDAPEVEP